MERVCVRECDSQVISQLISPGIGSRDCGIGFRLPPSKFYARIRTRATNYPFVLIPSPVSQSAISPRFILRTESGHVTFDLYPPAGIISFLDSNPLGFFIISSLNARSSSDACKSCDLWRNNCRPDRLSSNESAMICAICLGPWTIAPLLSKQKEIVDNALVFRLVLLVRSASHALPDHA